MDTETFSTVVERYYEPLYKFALSLTRAEADACDLTQQTFYLWATKGHQLRDRSKAKSWLFTTLYRAFLEARRKRVRHAHHQLQEVSEELPLLFPNLTERLDAAQAIAALAKVDEIYQSALALFYLDDCSYQEMAEILAVPLGTVKSRLARGISQLREILSTNHSLARSARPEANSPARIREYRGFKPDPQPTQP